jgi:hypothetical protein
MSALSKMLAVVVFVLSMFAQPAFAEHYQNEFAEYETRCEQVWNPRYQQVETVCDRVYTGRRYEVGPYARDGYCCVNGYRPNPYYAPRYNRGVRFGYYNGYGRGYRSHDRVQVELYWGRRW